MVPAQMNSPRAKIFESIGKIKSVKVWNLPMRILNNCSLVGLKLSGQRSDVEKGRPLIFH